MRARIALFSIKILKWILSFFGRGGSLPGTIALKIDPNFLTKLKYPKHVIMITGTNGKTTTTNQLYEVLKHSGLKTISNLKGDNMKMGIATVIGSHTNFHMQVQADALVLETDELNVPLVINEMKTSMLIVNNLFRDQGDRLGSIAALVEKIGQSLKNFQGILLLNGNDANVSSLSQFVSSANVMYFGVDKQAGSTTSSNEATEGKFCPLCGHQLNYAFYNYAHMGDFECPQCHFGDFSYTTLAQNVCEDGSFSVNGYVYKSPQNALYAIYNCCAIIACARQMGISQDFIAGTFQSFEFRGGRTETISVHGKPITLTLIKNPTGANETMKYIQSDVHTKDIVIIVNDAEGDGRDVSWYWDADFERVMQDNIGHIICSGLRAYDMALRFYYSDFSGKLEVIEEPSNAIKKLISYENHAYIMANYTALAPARLIVEKEAS